MSFFNVLSTVAKGLQDEVYKKAEQIEKDLKKVLRTKSDEEIMRLYNNRYNNPKFTEFHIRLVEEEAQRRGIE